VSTNDAVRKLNESIIKEVILPEISESLGVEFPLTLRRLSGNQLHLFQDIPPEVARIGEGKDTAETVAIALKNMPWIKKIVMAAIVKPRVVDKPIGEHGPDELSIDALEPDLYFLISEILALSGLATTEDAEAPQPFRAP